MRPKLTLTKRPDPATKPKCDPAKVSMSESFGWRFIERDHRYILQKLVVSYLEGYIGNDGHGNSISVNVETSRTWVDVPLVPEAYHG